MRNGSEAACQHLVNRGSRAASFFDCFIAGLIAAGAAGEMAVSLVLPTRRNRLESIIDAGEFISHPLIRRITTTTQCMAEICNARLLKSSFYHRRQQHDEQKRTILFSEAISAGSHHLQLNPFPMAHYFTTNKSTANFKRRARSPSEFYFTCT